MAVLLPRDCYYDEFTGNRRCSTWYEWGRWVAFAVIVGAAFIIFFIFACLSARARRRRGMHPYRGTGWMAPPAYNAQDYQNPPPQYSPHSNQGYYYGENYNEQNQGYGQTQGYFGGGGRGGQQTGIELQQPTNTYHGGDNVYAPPPGPPPAKK